MKKIGLLLLIWFSIVTIGAAFSYLLIYFLILGPLLAFLPDEIHWQSFAVIMQLSLLYSLPGFLIFCLLHLRDNRNTSKILSESPGIIIVLIILTFLVIAALAYPGIAIFLGFVPYVFATITFFSLINYFIKKR